MGRQFMDYTFNEFFIKTMGKILIIKGADFSKNAIESVTPSMVVIKTSVIPSGGGTVSGAGNYVLGSSVTLTATANSGYVFSRWSDGVTTASRTFTAASGLPTFTAEFTQEIPETPETSPIITKLDVVVELRTNINKIHINNRGGGNPRAAILVNDQSLMLDSTKVMVAFPDSYVDVTGVGVYTVTGRDSITLHVDTEKATAKKAIKWSFGVVDVETMSLVNEWKWNTEDVIVSGLNQSKTYAIIGNFANDSPATPILPLTHGVDFTIS